MPTWKLQTEPISISREVETATSLPSDGQVRSFSTIEQSGQQVVLLAHFNAAGIARHSTVLFPTRLVNARDPRGYLTVPLSLPQIPSPLESIEYDGNTLRLSDGRSVRASIFVSPSHPIVWSLLDYHQPQRSQESIGSSNRKLLQEGPFPVWREEQWTSTSRLLIAHTVVEHCRLSEALGDLEMRRKLTTEWTSAASFKCPSPEICALYYFAQIRLQESVFDAPNLGRVHSPGGGMFYSGVWCNDEAEYAAPALAMHGGPSSRAREAALNSLIALTRWFDAANTSVPYSVEVDGGYIGRLDRGDAGMFVWGASLTLLTIAEPSVTESVFPHVRFACAIMLEKMKGSPHGIVPSQSDELEGRFPTGDANLSVNCISILALEAAAEVAMDVNSVSLSDAYSLAATKLRENVHEYFQVPEPRAYSYFKGCKDSRGWACLSAMARLPNARDALRYVLTELWSEDGVLTTSESSDVWDRCTLYAIRAAFQNGMIDVATQRFAEYAKSRTTTGVAAPYAVENNSSWAQLSAESALVVRIVAEGLLGMDVRHGRKMILRPQCPQDWPGYSVTSVFFADYTLNFHVTRVGSKLRVEVCAGPDTLQKAVRAGAPLVLDMLRGPFLDRLE